MESSDSEVEVVKTTAALSRSGGQTILIKLRTNGSTTVTAHVVDSSLPLLPQLNLPTGSKVTFDGDVLLPSQTCISLDAEGGDVLDASVPQSEERITVKTRMGAGTEKSWSIPVSESFAKLSAAATAHYAGDTGRLVRLTFDGDAIKVDGDTPQSLDMEDSDVIDVILIDVRAASTAVIVTVRRNMNMRQTKKYKLSTLDPLVKVIQAHKKHYKSCKFEPRLFWGGEEVGGCVLGEVGYVEGEWMEVMDNGKEP